MSGPRVTIDLERIERNTRTVVRACRDSGIEVFGVTKGTCGMPQVARAMLRSILSRSIATGRHPDLPSLRHLRHLA